MEALLRAYTWREELDDVGHVLERTGERIRDGAETLAPALEKAGDTLRSSLPDMTRVGDSLMHALEVAGTIALHLLIGGLLGVAVMLAAAVVFGALVPLAMSLCGVVVAGVGTMHSSSGLAACFQRLAVHLMRPRPLLFGAFVGVVLAATDMIVNA